MPHPPRPGLAALVLAVPLVLAGCGGAASSAAQGESPSSASGSSDSASSASSGSAGSASASPSGCTVGRTITVKGSSVTPPPASVDVTSGCLVRLIVTVDRSSEVHVHVVNLDKPVTAGTPATIEFTPTQQGVYEVELHDPDLLLVKLAVR